MNDTPYIDVHTHRKTKPQGGYVSILNLFANQFHKPERKSNNFYSLGIHPWHISVDTPDPPNLIYLIEAMKNKAIIAIGETGLDLAIETKKKPQNLFYGGTHGRFQTKMGQQKAFFEKHLELAQSTEKPAIVHAVHTYPDIVEVYNKSRVNVNMVFHGFNGNLEIAEQLIKRGFYLSFGEHLFNSTRKAVGVFKEIPLGNIFLETDESEKSITAIYDKAAEIKGLGRSVLKDNIYNNFTHCFGKII